MTRYFRGLLVGLLWGVLVGFILDKNDAPDISYGAVFLVLVFFAVMDLMRYAYNGEVD